jgi:rubrerythrin
MEEETRRFYLSAREEIIDPPTRELLNHLAEAELKHSDIATEIEKGFDNPQVIEQEAEARRRTIVLQYIQPGLAGLMDGSVSTLAPLFAAAFATHKSWDAFLVGLAASVGAGISMGFAEALSDDGSLTGRGKPVIRGVICGAMTTAGGIGHTLPYMIADFQIATAVAVCVVAVELGVISWVRHRFMETPILRAAVQVAVGGVLVFLAGLFIGKS